MPLRIDIKEQRFGDLPIGALFHLSRYTETHRLSDLGYRGFRTYRKTSVQKAKRIGGTEETIRRSGRTRVWLA